MRILPIIVLFLMASCCEYEFKARECNMIVSDALPIQFWVNGKTPFNDLDICRMNRACFFQEFHCDDEIRLRLTDDVLDNSYELDFFDTDNELIETLEFTKHELLHTESALPSFTEWTNDPDNTTDWNISSTPSLPSTTTPSTIESDLSEFPPGEITFSYDFAMTQFSSMSIKMYDYNDNLIASWSLTQSASSAPRVGTRTVTCESQPYRISITFTPLLTNGIATINSLTISKYRLLTDYHELIFTPREQSMCNTKVKLKIEQDGVGYVAESDWLNFVDETCWIQTSYRSNKNFAGIIYETGEDYGEYFYTRFPVQFFHQDNPQESVTVELSSSEVITTSTNLKERRRLLSDYMPDYMHKKLQLILAHAANGDVIIDGDYWSIQDAYEREDPPDINYPMKSATTYLTKKNFYLRNIT